MGTTAQRREVMKQLGLAFGMGVLAPSVFPDRALAAPSVDEENFTRTDIEVESFDGTSIMATVYEPDAEGPHPALLGTHGWAGDRGSLDSVAAIYANNGYAGLIYDSRGFGESGGEVTLTGENEQKDAQALIDWLADQSFVETDSEGDPKLGMDGGSYGGGIQPRLATNDDRVDAIVPRYTWYDLTEALLPNGVLKAGWALGLLTAGSARGTLDDEFKTRSEEILNTGELSAENRTYFESRSTPSYPDLDAPTLVIQALNDRLFPADQGLKTYQWAQDNDVETALLLGNAGAHTLSTPEGKPDWPPGTDAFETFAQQAAIDWLDAHVKGEGDHGLAPVTYQDVTRGEFVEADEFPPADMPERTFSHALDETVTLDGPDAEPLTIDWQIGRETEIVGQPSLELAVRPTGDGDSHLMAAIRRVSGDEVTTIKEQVTPLEIGSETTLQADLRCIQGVFEPGDRLRLALATRSEALTDISLDLGTEGLFRDTAENAGIEIQDTTAVELTVAAPSGAGPPSLPGLDAPRDFDGDGNYEDVRGDGTVDVFDVQTLFANLDSDEIQNNAEFFNFQGGNADEVTIFDVQALFSKL
jgi:pimeloyl-ACP methyl ester carboxylesterase